MTQITDAEISRILWSFNSLLLGIIVIIFKTWIAGVNKKLETKLDSERCLERYKRTQKNVEDLFKHKHPIYKDNDKTGEVVIP